MGLATITVSPAYGRDYASAAAALEAWAGGKDFVIRWPLHEAGRYCSVRDFRPGPDGAQTEVRIRYAKLTRVVVTSA